MKLFKLLFPIGTFLEATYMTNHLAGETSPYLKQHVHNPVDWYPWGNKAFRKAKNENKPIFLSVGYSSCHWCHVMAHESFEDEKTARFLNEHFVSIKLDREERPDLDQIYQHVIQMMGERGGWPLSIFMTPEKKPFFAGTYFPNVRKYGMRSFLEILQNVVESYKKRKNDLEHTGNQVLDTLEKMVSLTTANKDELSKDILELAMANMEPAFDTKNGGFGGAPKFPDFAILLFIIRQIAEYEKIQPEKYKIVKENLETTLDRMATGGIYDHVGGGFARYSVDEQWMIPHFEKMLYDNALAIQVYSEAFYLFQKARYKELVRETVNWVIQEMYCAGKGFYSALDADSEGEEGKYYVWTKSELQKIVPYEKQNRFFQAYGVTEKGNFEYNTNHLYIADESLVQKYGDEFKDILQSIYSIRHKRVPPSLDDKILTAWTSLMITGLYSAFRILLDPTIKQIAHIVTQFVSDYMYSSNERILYRVFDPNTKKRKIMGHLDDYAYFIQALFEDFQYYPQSVTFDLIKNLIQAVEGQFGDTRNNGYFYSSGLNSDVVTRMKISSDLPLPSANAVMVQNLLRIFFYTGEQKYFHSAENAFRLHSESIISHPTAYGAFLISVQWYLFGPIDIVVLDTTKSREEVIKHLHKFYSPRLHLWYQSEILPELKSLLNKVSFHSKYTLYFCKNYNCFTPTMDWMRFTDQLKQNLIELP